MPKPDGNHLPQAVTHLRRLGIDILASLLEAHEIDRFGLDEEKKLCAASGIRFVHFPIVEGDIPADTVAFPALVDELRGALEAGARVVIHCRAGIGRTGVLAGCILRRDGYDASSATQMLSCVRDFSLPETKEQYNFIVDFGG